MLLSVVGSVKKMDDYKCSLTVVDVYDIAQEIGREFESLIDAYGTDAITGLMPKVVTALEQMELLAMSNERENTTVEDLRATIQQLEMDKQERTEDRIKYEKVIAMFSKRPTVEFGRGKYTWFRTVWKLAPSRFVDQTPFLTRELVR